MPLLIWWMIQKVQYWSLTLVFWYKKPFLECSFVFQNMLWWHGPNWVRSIVVFKYCASYDIFILITVINLSIISSAWHSYKQWWSAWPGICPLYVLFSAYRCPLCMHSAWNMEHNWEQMDKEITQSPMPTEYQDAIVKVWHACIHFECEMELYNKQKNMLNSCGPLCSGILWLPWSGVDLHWFI